jgi:SAM-dependent methyltransferase
VAWHDLECASYAADLDTWAGLAAAAPGPVLDLGSGSGRVALHLAELGHEVTALDADADLVAALASRARGRGLRVDCVAADARSFRIGRRFGLVLAAMQVMQLLGGRSGRKAALARVREHLLPRARFAAALADPFEAVPPEDALPPLPDVAEVDGWVLSSRPTDVRPAPGGVALDRLRQLVSPGGELSEELHTVLLESVAPAELEREAAEAGLRAAGRLAVEATRDHVGSTVVVLEGPP